jgi:hypothetical protein
MPANTSITDGATTELRAAAAQAKDVFSRHPAPPFPLGVCLACCMTPEIERELREWKPSALTAHHLYEYNTSAKPPSQSVPELGHFLPRMFELMVAGRDIHHSTELFLVRLGNCPADSWRADERAAIERFSIALFDVVLRGATLPDTAHPWTEDPLATLLMFDIGGVAIEPLLVAWLRCEHPASTIQYVESTYWHFWEDETYSNPFATDRPSFQRRLRDWLLDPECRRVFAAKLLHPDFQEAARMHVADGRVPFPLVIEAVFDHLTR